ncbi:AAA family ATPase [Paracoccus sp. TK19116]|uniref:AAA family ATPase n=1 Tax=Paracoccus albicereus TaxID=2922394 RepID=A0ABT1MTZ1_9RHOB|nr:AAA family ATPase [Paracoccus albicereus]MCQ0971802.1 AAA family ATPase [Paracoccus albicereus]
MSHLSALPSRAVVALAGAPGSGKSTLAEALVARIPGAVLLPMDGFHLDNAILDARGLRARKGAPETFDAEGFVTLVQRLAQGGEVVFPIFDRARDLAVAGAGVIARDTPLVVVEGNYLLLNRAPWTAARYNLTLFLDRPQPVLAARLTARWQSYGKEAEAIASHLKNDLANAALVAGGSRPADIVLRG